jgi:hypothetical protein
MDETELARIRARYADEAPDVLAWRVDHVPESWRDVRTLLAEVGRLRADRTALEHRLEDLMDRWADERNALVRAAVSGDDGAGSFVDEARADTLWRCIEGLDGAIPGE